MYQLRNCREGKKRYSAPPYLWLHRHNQYILISDKKKMNRNGYRLGRHNKNSYFSKEKVVSSHENNFQNVLSWNLTFFFLLLRDGGGLPDKYRSFCHTYLTDFLLTSLFAVFWTFTSSPDKQRKRIEKSFPIFPTDDDNRQRRFVRCGVQPWNRKGSHS